MIGLLRPFRITVDDQFLPIQEESKSALLICHLALARGRRVPKDILLERLWPQKSPPKAAPCLNSLTYALNKTIKQVTPVDGLVHFRGGAYHLDINERAAVDIDFFNDWIQEGLIHIANERFSQGIELFERAISLYRGDLCFVDTMQALIERERLRIMLLNTLAFLADYHFQQGRYLQVQLFAVTTKVSFSFDTDKKETRIKNRRTPSIPCPPAAAQTPESMAKARLNAPNSVRTLGRIVSLSDFEDVAREHSLAAKARASLVWMG